MLKHKKWHVAHSCALQMSLSNQALKLLALMFIERLLVQELHIKPYRGLGSSSPCLACYKEKDVATEYVSWVQARTIGELCSLSDRWVQSRSRATLGISQKIMWRIGLVPQRFQSWVNWTPFSLLFFLRDGFSSPPVIQLWLTWLHVNERIDVSKPVYARTTDITDDSLFNRSTMTAGENPSETNCNTQINILLVERQDRRTTH